MDETEQQLLEMQEQLQQLVQQTSGCAKPVKKQAAAKDKPIDKDKSLRQQLVGIESKQSLTLRHLMDLSGQLKILLANASAEAKYRMQQKLASDPHRLQSTKREQDTKLPSKIVLQPYPEVGSPGVIHEDLIAALPLDKKIATIEKIQSNISMKNSTITDLQKRIQDLEAALAEPVLEEESQTLSKSHDGTKSAEESESAIQPSTSEAPTTLESATPKDLNLSSLKARASEGFVLAASSGTLASILAAWGK
jgi:hypothetical protein